LTDIFVDGDAYPVREEIYRMAARLKVKVFVVSNGSRPIRPPGMSNVSMVLVGDTADAADDWIAERVGAMDVCVTSDIPLASRCLKKGARVVLRAGSCPRCQPHGIRALFRASAASLLLPRVEPPGSTLALKRSMTSPRLALDEKIVGDN
jgi:hypothetical protein